jgi:hypothetical protein
VRRLGGASDSVKLFDKVDPTLPHGFLSWERARSYGKHIDRDFMSPDRMFAFRSRTAVTEYIKLLGKRRKREVLNFVS